VKIKARQNEFFWGFCGLDGVQAAPAPSYQIRPYFRGLTRPENLFEPFVPKTSYHGKPL
jgi:hypothetical protein